MQLHINKPKPINKIPAKVCLAVFGALFVAGSIGTTYHLTKASASEYSLTGSDVTINGTSDGTATVTLKTSVARSYVAIQGTWSLHEVVGSAQTQTSYLSLSEITRGNSIPMEFGSNGTALWTPSLGEDGMPVGANGAVMTATYTVDKDTPEGTYTISLSEGLFTYDINGSDVDEDDTIAADATIRVTRTNPSDPDTPDTPDTPNTPDTPDTPDTPVAPVNPDDSDTPSNPNDTDSTTTDEAESDGATRTGGLAVPNTGQMSQDGNGANVIAISVASVVVIAVSIVAILQLKNHKKISFNKSND